MKTNVRILIFIQNYIDVNGWPPSIREIGEGVELRSTSTVWGHLQRLIDQGLIEKSPRENRALKITEAGIEFLGKLNA